MTTTRLLQLPLWDGEGGQSLPCSSDMGHTRCSLWQHKANSALPSPTERSPGVPLPSQPRRSSTSTATLGEHRQHRPLPSASLTSCCN